MPQTDFKLTKTEEACVKALKEAFPPSSVPVEDIDFLQSDTTYIRYAVAVEGGVERAKKRLADSIAWRKEWAPAQITFEKVKDAYENSGPLRLGGQCKEGRPVVLLTLTEEDSSRPLRKRLNCMCYIMESFIRKGYGKITWIVDFGERDREKKKEDKEKDAMRKQAMAILDEHYPERLGQMIFFRAPWYMTMLLAVIKRTLPSNTRPKIINVGSEMKDLEKYIDISQIPERIGGKYPEWHLTDLEEKLPPFSQAKGAEPAPPAA